MALKLMQLLATEKATKNASETFFTKAYQNVQKADLVNGFSRTYQPRKDGDEVFPPEKKLVVIRVEETIDELTKVLGELFDVTAQKDATNMNAKADVVLPNGTVLLKGVPATHLLFLERKLVDLINFAEKLPVQDPAESWKLDGSQNLYVTDPTKTVKTKKVESIQVVVQPTKEHPAQTAKITQDEIIGDWSTVKFTSALQHDRVKQIVARAKILAKAVKIAREEANTVEVVSLKSSPLLSYIFEGE